MYIYYYILTRLLNDRPRVVSLSLAFAISNIIAMLDYVFACFQNEFCSSVLDFMLGLALTAQTLCDDC